MLLHYKRVLWNVKVIGLKLFQGFNSARAPVVVVAPMLKPGSDSCVDLLFIRLETMGTVSRRGKTKAKFLVFGCRGPRG